MKRSDRARNRRKSSNSAATAPRRNDPALIADLFGQARAVRQRLG
jgi:hypothetical protein